MRGGIFFSPHSFPPLAARFRGFREAATFLWRDAALTGARKRPRDTTRETRVLSARGTRGLGPDMLMGKVKP